MKRAKPPPPLILLKQERFKTEPFSLVQLSKYLESLWQDWYTNRE